MPELPKLTIRRDAMTVVLRLRQAIADLGDSEDLTGCDGNEMLEAVLDRIAQFIEDGDAALAGEETPDESSNAGRPPLKRENAGSSPASSTPAPAKCVRCNGTDPANCGLCGTAAGAPTKCEM